MLSNRPSLLSVLQWMTEQCSGSIAPLFGKGDLSEKLRRFSAIEPPFTVPIVGKCSGSITPNFLIGNPSTNLVLLFALLIVGKRSGSIAPFGKNWCYRTAPLCCQYLQWITQQHNGSIAPKFSEETLQKIWCYRTAAPCCQCLLWVTQQCKHQRL